jgi:predicted signal transduction protein with EAL and GGDEF domain
VARLGSDEFAVVLPNVDASGAAEIARRLVGSFGEPFALEGVALHVDASIGVALWPDQATDGPTLLRQADNAMSAAKSARTGWQAYTTDCGGHGRDRLELIEDLRTAVATGELVLHYQPKVDVASGELLGVEGLARWPHPRHGMLYPDSFVPLAEQTGLMRAVTSNVLRIAMSQCRAWRDIGIDLTVAVNLSVSNLVDAHLATEVGDLLAEFDLPPELVELEITESTLMRDMQRGRQALDAVRALGIRLAIDDYGTGYSSLSYLRQLPIDDLKIDKSFVIGMTEDVGARAIVHSTIDLAHRLGLRVVAEGVESAGHLDDLGALGCDIAQGYHIARPMPADDLPAWLRARQLAPLAR